jgi:phosphoribosylcarboxyaminoimidazole (NCAIR) mutase
MKNQVRVNLGSKSDAPLANEFLAILRNIGVRYGVSVGSCHWSAGDDFRNFIESIEEDILVGIGGMSFAATGIIAALDRNAERTGRIIVAVPLDKAAQSAIEDLPPGTPVLTCGYNRVNVKASITNAALAVANIVARTDKEVRLKLEAWYRNQRKKKGIIPEVKLVSGLIPEK